MYPARALCQAADLARCRKHLFPRSFKFMNQMDSELMKWQDDAIGFLKKLVTSV